MASPVDAYADLARRALLGAAALGVAAAALPVMPSPAEAAPIGPPRWTLREVATADLIISFAELGPADGPPVILLHRWPYDIHAFAEVAPILAAAGRRVIVPHLRGFGATRFRSEASPRNGQPAALAQDVIALMDALRIPTVVIAGFDWGARLANIVAALWPARCRALVSVSGYLISGQQANQTPLSPEDERAWWYLFYFATDAAPAATRSTATPSRT